MSIPNSAIEREKRFEKNISYMYQDSGGNVTVGYGHLMSSDDAATTISFVHRSDGQIATDDEKRNDFTKVSNADGGQIASWYKKFTALDLANAESDRLLLTDLAQAQKYLEAAFSGYDDFPSPAQEALLDMMFNLGPGNFSKAKWPTLLGAIESMDWETAAAHCHRTGVPEDRNIEIRELFEKASVAAITDSSMLNEGEIPQTLARVMDVLRPSFGSGKAGNLFPNGIRS